MATKRPDYSRAPICTGTGRGFCKKPGLWQDKKTREFLCEDCKLGRDVEYTGPNPER